MWSKRKGIKCVVVKENVCWEGRKKSERWKVPLIGYSSRALQLDREIMSSLWSGENCCIWWSSLCVCVWTCVCQQQGLMNIQRRLSAIISQRSSWRVVTHMGGLPRNLSQSPGSLKKAAGLWITFWRLHQVTKREKQKEMSSQRNLMDIIKITVYYQFDLLWMTETENDDCMLITF